MKVQGRKNGDSVEVKIRGRKNGDSVETFERHTEASTWYEIEL